MKMFRLLTGMIALSIFALTGCSTKSPDFVPQLSSIQISYTAVAPAPPPNATGTTTYAVGDQLQFTATGMCTTAPGTKPAGSLQPCSVNASDVTWSVDNATNGSITSTGLFTVKGPTSPPGATGAVTVTGTSNGHNSNNVTVGTQNIATTTAVLRTLVISPTTALVPQHDTQTFTLTGVNSDGSAATLDPTKITWSATDVVGGGTTVASIPPTSATASNIATANAASGDSTITATALNTLNQPVTVSAVLSVGGATLKSIVGTKLSPPSAAKAIGGTQDYVLMAVYSDNVTRPVPNSKINWTIDASGTATLGVVATASKATLTAVKVGQATVTATLTPAASLVLDDPTKNTANGTLTVVDAACTTPLSNQNTPAASTATAVTGPLCLICGVASADNVIDANPTNAASLNATLGVGLPTNEISLTVNSNAATPFPGGADAGFHVADPTGALLSANVLNGEIQVSTLLAGTVQESSTPYVAGGLIPLPPLLDITLLGLGAGGGAYVTVPTTKPYDAIRVTFSTGLVSALSTVNVDSACGTVDLTKVTP